MIVAAVGALIYSAVRETSAYYLTVDEYAADPGAHAGRFLRLAGRVADGSVRWDPSTLDLSFEMHPIPARGDEAGAADAAPPPADARLAVRYNGVLPDMFAAGRDVIVEGRVEDGVFVAQHLLTTCPSKYEAEVAPPDEGPTASS